MEKIVFIVPFYIRVNLSSEILSDFFKVVHQDWKLSLLIKVHINYTDTLRFSPALASLFKWYLSEYFFLIIRWIETDSSDPVYDRNMFLTLSNKGSRSDGL